MNKLLLVTASGVVVAGVVGLGAMTASAQSNQEDGAGMRMGMHQGAGYEASLESRAKVVGMDVEELRTALETKTMSQIAIEQGIDEDTFRSSMLEAAKERWEARGLSADEIAERIAERNERHEANSADHEFGSGEGGRRGGFGRH